MFPADAGMIPLQLECVLRIRCVPRGCGDDPERLITGELENRCSPRMRG